MSKHTPGPWSIGSADNYTRRTIVGPREGMSHKLIARMPGEYRENHAIFPEMLANAHLIAAAPAMYAWIARVCKDGLSFEDIKEGRALLSHAEGVDHA